MNLPETGLDFDRYANLHQISQGIKFAALCIITIRCDYYIKDTAASVYSTKPVIMGKNKKNKAMKRALKPLVADSNGLLFAALGGVAAGITLASILGTGKARQIVQTVEDSVNEFSNRVKTGFQDRRPLASEDSSANGLKKEMV